MKTVIILTAVSYHSMKQRPHHFSDYLLDRGYNVMFFNISGRKMLLKLEDFNNLFTNDSYKKYFSSPKENLLVADYNLYKIEDGKFTGFDEFLGNLENNLGTENVIFLAAFPDWDKYIGKLSPDALLIYDCIDDWEEFSHKEDFLIKRSTLSREKHIASISKCVICSAWKLYLKMSYLNSNLYYLPNGTNPRDYLKSDTIPSDIRNISKPISIFVGSLSAWIDYEIIDYISLQRPQYSFVYIGPVLNSDILPNRENIHYLGQKYYKELSDYMCQARAAIIPFEVTKLSASVTPLKYYEYCSAGLPTVMTIFPDLYGLNSGKMAVNKEDFVEKLDCYMNMPEEEYNIEVEKAKSVGMDFEWGNLLGNFLKDLEGFTPRNLNEILRSQIKIYENFTSNPAMKNMLMELYNRDANYEKAVSIGEELLQVEEDIDYIILAHSYLKLGNIQRAVELIKYASGTNEYIRQYYDTIMLLNVDKNNLIEIVTLKFSGFIYEAISKLDELISSTDNELLYGLLADFYQEVGEFIYSFNALAYILEKYKDGLNFVFTNTLEILADYFINISEFDTAEDLAFMIIEKGHRDLGEKILGNIYLTKAKPVQPTIL